MKSISIITLGVATLCWGARIKDISSLRGERSNQLIGYGIVAGLNGSGDKNADASAMPQFLKGLGIEVKKGIDDQRNTAQVMVVAEMAPFSTVGSRMDVVVSSIVNATSLEGGTLLMTPLKGADGTVYAIAQGKVMITRRKDVRGGLLSQVLASGSVSQGAVLEKMLPIEVAHGRNVIFNLHQPDFTTAARMAIRINEELGGKYAIAIDAGRVEVIFPYEYENSAVELVALLESIEIEADRKAKIVINATTGTVILGERVTIAPVAVAHGNLRLEVSNPVAQVAPRDKSVALLPKSASVADLAGGLNELGATPDDLVAILSALKAAGAIMAEVQTQ